jgi:hypothetical protein
VATLQRASRAVDADRRHHPALALFSVMWALAALWHLLGNTYVGSTWSAAALAVAVGVVLWRPGATGGLTLLAITSPSRCGRRRPSSATTGCWSVSSTSSS